MSVHFEYVYYGRLPANMNRIHDKFFFFIDAVTHEMRNEVDSERRGTTDELRHFRRSIIRAMFVGDITNSFPLYYDSTLNRTIVKRLPGPVYDPKSVYCKASLFGCSFYSSNNPNSFNTMSSMILSFAKF